MATLDRRYRRKVAARAAEAAARVAGRGAAA
jgi:hypothetical protein